MNIIIDNGLDDIKEALKSRGYNVYNIGDNVVADAILYREKDKHPYYEVNNLPSATSSVANGKNSAYGAILINVNNKSIEEIENILNKRVYSPLF
jgi:broad-specificity NMP kinase